MKLQINCEDEHRIITSQQLPCMFPLYKPDLCKLKTAQLVEFIGNQLVTCTVQIKFEHTFNQTFKKNNFFWVRFRYVNELQANDNN